MAHYKKVIYENINGDMDVIGRIIGGCIDVLKDLIGTKYDGTIDFIDKYKDDGIIWYFDNFALKSEDLFNSLWHMKQAGWFKYAKGFLIGRTYSAQDVEDFTYIDALKKGIGCLGLPVVFDLDIGHQLPQWTIINGAYGIFKFDKGNCTLIQKYI